MVAWPCREVYGTLLVSFPNPLGFVVNVLDIPQVSSLAVTLLHPLLSFALAPYNIVQCYRHTCDFTLEAFEKCLANWILPSQATVKLSSMLHLCCCLVTTQVSGQISPLSLGTVLPSIAKLGASVAARQTNKSTQVIVFPPTATQCRSPARQGSPGTERC